MEEKKSFIAALLLTFLFGPIGLLYASVLGGVMLMLIAFMLALAAPPVVVGGIAWIASMIWALASVLDHNAAIEKKVAEKSIKEKAETKRQKAAADDEWETLVKYDDGARQAVEILQPHGAEAIQELRRAHDVVGDKSQLVDIAQKIAADREAEGEPQQA